MTAANDPPIKVEAVRNHNLMELSQVTRKSAMIRAVPGMVGIGDEAEYLTMVNGVPTVIPCFVVGLRFFEENKITYDVAHRIYGTDLFVVYSDFRGSVAPKGSITIEHIKAMADMLDVGMPEDPQAEHPASTAPAPVPARQRPTLSVVKSPPPKPVTTETPEEPTTTEPPPAEV